MIVLSHLGSNPAEVNLCSLADIVVYIEIIRYIVENYVPIRPYHRLSKEKLILLSTKLLLI